LAICTVEIFIAGRWTRTGELHVVNESTGYAGPARFEYDFDYLESHHAALGAIDARAVSCRYPLGYDVRDEPHWPAFLLDVIPSGAARRFWEREIGVPNAPSSDWAVLLRGAGNPPGNLRIAEAALPPPVAHPGFTRDDVVARAERFLEYARAAGAAVAGASGAGGDSPKLLLREDRSGRFHPDGGVDDAATRAFWLVKFPRSKQNVDHIVLEAEAGYQRIARRFGVRVHGEVTWESGCLFVPRFDRVKDEEGGVGRLGLESLCSLAGVSDFAVPIPKESQADALAKFASDRGAALREFVHRDVLDVALGNTDNHARNTAVLKDERGKVALAPLYDFAPMLLDSEGIVRVSRWGDEVTGFPRWTAALDVLGEGAREWMKALIPRVRALPQWLDEERVPELVRREVLPRIERVARDLEEATR
jgi:serine/threonine-protein kinase HipA